MNDPNPDQRFAISSVSDLLALLERGGPLDQVPVAALGGAVSCEKSSKGSLWFRGQSNEAWPLSPTIWRSAYNYTPADERWFIHEFRARASTRHSVEIDYEDQPKWLSTMQHYGLPTRLLDWSRSPLVALFFAIGTLASDHSLQTPPDAALWILDPYLFNSIHYKGFVTPSINSKKCRFAVEEAFRTPHAGYKPHSAMAILATESDSRMFVQQGVFTIHRQADQSLIDHRLRAAYLAKIVIPGESKRKIAKELKILGIREGDVFPDLEHLASELKKAAKQSFGSPWW